MSAPVIDDRAPFALRGHNPDVLTCIANLSNDEVFTPPELANQMLDTLADAWAEAHDGASIWEDPDVAFLDPFTKSGVFLREITRRLTEGLAEQIPDLWKRVDHILTKQVYGIGITRLTALLARRSVYCSKDATGEHSVAMSFDRDWGNIWFERTEHTWAGDKCAYCGANRAAYDRSGELETHAYAFIHTTDIKARLARMFGADVQFDVIIGNPPYQLADAGFGASATPIYQHFVRQALALEPRMLSMVTPSRWFTGGKGLDDFREEMLGDTHIRQLVDFPKLYDVFESAKIRGGVSYFLWDANYDGPCVVHTFMNGEEVGEPATRYLGDYDVLVRRNEAVSILEKVLALGEPSFASKMPPRKTFGWSTTFHGVVDPAILSNPVQVFGSRRVSWVERASITTNAHLTDKWKVLMTAAQGTSAAVETKFLSRPIVAGPGTACTDTYILAGVFDDEESARCLERYLRTRFVRFLVSLRKITQHANRDVYSFVPAVPLDRRWSDAELNERYGLAPDEITFLQSQVAAHDDDVSTEPADA
ncbi:restriction endonuclease [Microbacterium protaetiae]|uniref:site-specific DNA-methyltransferase (adenine-specific) n=1 Tax=Microbacterium protaetiae TaxID=2509458 RepID=A0A4P6EAX6_9MICO|nr:Eco57I restriction-modification methylase domain-containing protein [Microbacterium protaetiae]QAY59265.1 restriction endonuclease [Microbacterium protaetiae]